VHSATASPVALAFSGRSNTRATPLAHWRGGHATGKARSAQGPLRNDRACDGRPLDSNLKPLPPPVHPDRPADELEALLAKIATAVGGRRPPIGMATRIVAIDGLGGAGKSTLAEKLSITLDGADIVHTDDFASWENPIDWWPQLIEKVLEPISRNEPVSFQASQWDAAHDPERVEFRPDDFVIVEGVTAAREAFVPYLTYTIWVEAPEEVRLRRGLKRDGQTARKQWELWMAEEATYRSRERPDGRADLVIRGDRNIWT
jgi:uridine kinase